MPKKKNLSVQFRWDSLDYFISNTVDLWSLGDFDDFRNYYSRVSHRRRRQVCKEYKAFQLGTAAVCYREKDCKIDVLCIYVYVYYTYTYARHVSWIDSNVGSIGSRWFHYWRILAYQAIPYSPTRFFFFSSSLSVRSVDDCNILSLNSRVPGEREPFRDWNLIFFVSATPRTAL